MSGITDIYSQYQQTNYGLIDYLTGSQDSGNGSSTQLLSASAQKKDIQAQVEAILSGVEPDANGKITMNGVIAQRDELIESFESGIKADLEALGVDPDVEFSLSHNAQSNTLTVSSSHPQADVVKQYFKDHPELADTFSDIRMLSSVADLAENPLPVSQLRKQMQTQFAGEILSQGYIAGSALNMGVSASGVSLMQGLNLTV